MRPTPGELTTNVVDLSRISLFELRDSTDPVLLHSLGMVAEQAECGRAGVLQNQASASH